MPSTKRVGDEVDDTPTAALPVRVDGSADAAAPPNKKKNAASSRTGQACDRCKIRKIRCDARPDGCSPCIQNNTECKTTDRITGRATSRGHAETLENEVTALKLYIIELQAQVKDLGHEPKQQPPIPQGYIPGATYWSAHGDAYALPSNGLQQTPRTERHASIGSSLPKLRAGCVGDNYVGICLDRYDLSSVHGTSLTLFGARIDLADFMPPETSLDAKAMSYQTFLSYAFQGRHAPQPELPPYNNCKTYADWWIRSVSQFLPILHKPDLMHLLVRIYHEGYTPSAAETVMVHMILAMMNFQWSARNGNDPQSRSAAFAHYHYALTLVPQLLEGHKLEDIQALTIICSQLRSQPRPGAAWIFTNTVMGLAIETGLHRTASAWPEQASEQDPHITEMRKRVFWSLLLIHVSISGKLGRPMPLRFEDFDIEIPEAVSDNLPGESNMNKWKKCSFRSSILGFKLLKILMQVYSTVYAIRSNDGDYDVNIRRIEKELQAFQSQVPPELAYGTQTKEEDRVISLYIQLAEAQCQLLLHHPSLDRSNSPQVSHDNLDSCLKASQQMLFSATHLKELMSLDTTWYFLTDFLAAIFTTMFVYRERSDQTTSSELSKLRQDMYLWLDVLGEAGKMLGTGALLQNAVRRIIDGALTDLQQHVTSKTAEAAVATMGSPSGPPGQEQPQHHQRQVYEANNPYYPPQSHGTTGGHAAQPQAYPMHAQQHAHQNPYPSGNHFPYPEPQSVTVPQYNTNHVPTFDTSAYTAEEIKPHIEAQINAELAQQTPQQAQHQMASHQPPPPSNFMAAFQSPQQAHNGYQQAPSVMAAANFQPTGPAAWRDFADNMMTNINGHDYMTSAQTLMALGAANAAPTGNGSLEAQTGNALGGLQIPEAGSQQWPLVHYDDKYNVPTVSGSDP